MADPIIEQFLNDHIEKDDLYRVRYENKVSLKSPMTAYYSITITSRHKHITSLAFRRELYKWLDAILYPSALYGYIELHPTLGGYHCHCISRTGWLPPRKRMNFDKWNIYTRKITHIDEVTPVRIVQHYLNYARKALPELEVETDDFAITFLGLGRP